MDSPIKDMFPETKDIVIDMIHKEQLWQCIPMIPYLDVNRIKEECSKYKLSKNDMILNKIFSEIKY
jgi:5'-3' exonuclease